MILGAELAGAVLLGAVVTLFACRAYVAQTKAQRDDYRRWYEETDEKLTKAHEDMLAARSQLHEMQRDEERGMNMRAGRALRVGQEHGIFAALKEIRRPW